jgi:iron complex transport system substrate-binding protein
MINGILVKLNIFMRKQLISANSILVLFFTFFLTVCCVNEALARTVTDDIGRRVNIISAPHRIISLAPGITETLYALGLADNIAGVTTFCDWPVAARTKQRIGGFTNPSIEKIVSLKPDLIIATADGNRRDTVLQLENLGLSVYVINPADANGVLRNILQIGKITNREETAVKLAGKLQNRLNNITAQIRNKKKPRVFFQLGRASLFTAGNKTLINEVIERAGGINVAGHDTARYPVYSTEGIIAASPEIIVYAPMVNDKKFVSVKTSWQKFGEIPAVKNNKIYPIDADLINRASPRIFDAIEIMALIFHPDIKYSR